MEKFSVLISVYINDDPIFFKKALNSIYYEQTLKPSQIVIVGDGNLNESQLSVINKFSRRVGANIVNFYQLDENLGLANALNYGLKKCKFDLVARMDADDISLPERFHIQIKFMVENPNIDVCGSYINEINPYNEKLISTKKVPLSHEEIYTFGKKRSPMNHPSVIFKKEKILSLGGYPLFRKSQDFALWSLLLNSQSCFSNLDIVLLHMRCGKNLLQKRGLFHLKQEIKVINFQRRIGFISRRELIYSIFIRSMFRLSPIFIRKYLYKILRAL
ncbi:glycosyltransferase [Xenorhabdus sp. IM139775]|uniref:glycosyltransferase n=1 Tax=Xenorhabdus sp. IM139775 TaxID=3025876 RepID=UPI0023588E01|nr:glycosyltransferase [Xenorhabdus sp. IM139775]MDC9592797.1 glycosyltransferase [Xenorhabdus sp. IM139775]